MSLSVIEASLEHSDLVTAQLLIELVEGATLDQSVQGLGGQVHRNRVGSPKFLAVLQAQSYHPQPAFNFLCLSQHPSEQRKITRSDSQASTSALG